MEHSTRFRVTDPGDSPYRWSGFTARDMTRTSVTAKHSGQGPMFRRSADRGPGRFWQAVHDQGLAGFRVGHARITPDSFPRAIAPETQSGFHGIDAPVHGASASDCELGPRIFKKATVNLPMLQSRSGSCECRDARYHLASSGCDSPGSFLCREGESMIMYLTLSDIFDETRFPERFDRIVAHLPDAGGCHRSSEQSQAAAASCELAF